MFTKLTTVIELTVKHYEPKDLSKHPSVMTYDDLQLNQELIYKNLSVKEAIKKLVDLLNVF